MCIFALVNFLFSPDQCWNLKRNTPTIEMSIARRIPERPEYLALFMWKLSAFAKRGHLNHFKNNPAIHQQLTYNFVSSNNILHEYYSGACSTRRAIQDRSYDALDACSAVAQL